MNLCALLRPGARPVVAALLFGLLSSLDAGWSFAADAPRPKPAAHAGSVKPIPPCDLHVTSAWARATVASTPVAAVYFTLINRGQQADTLLGASSAVAASATLHRSVQSNGMAKMHAAGEIGIAAGQMLKVEPNGLHLMLDGLRQPLAAGTRIPVVLEFRRAGKVTVQVDVVPLGAVAPGGNAPRGPMQHDRMAH